MSTLDRLREIVRGSGRQTSSIGAPPPSVDASANAGSPPPVRELVYEAVDEAGQPMISRSDLPDIPGASFCDTSLGRCIVIERAFDADALHGQVRIEEARLSSADVLGFCAAQAAPTEDHGEPWGPPRPNQPDFASVVAASSDDRVDVPPLDVAGAAHAAGVAAAAGADDANDAAAGDGSPVLFLDLETTGLSGGAGTVAFLVGCGFFDAQGAFRTRQFLLPGFGAERALLQAVTATLAEAGSLVTYNGKTFDLPVMETRWLFHRQPLAWTDLTHLDMLHVSRRLWRARGDDSEASCRLVFLERDLFGVGRVGDVPGFEIPGRYFDYVRHGDADVLEPVLHHNRLDLLSLALLTARAIRLLREGIEATRDPREWLAIGRELVRLQQRSRAEACFQAVIDCPFAPDPVRAEALYSWARLLRRARRHREAAEAWRQLVACRSARGVLRAEAQEALAVHYEHRDRNLGAAHQWAADAYAAGISPNQRDAVAHRLARLKRKMTVPAGIHSAAVRTKGGPKTAFTLRLAYD